MYIYRRGRHWYFRKALPLSLRDVLGPEVRFSLGTESRREAQRRAQAVLVALDDVYEIFRSDAPIEPVRRLLGAFRTEFRKDIRGVHDQRYPASMALGSATDSLQVEFLPPPSPEDGQTLVSLDALDPILIRETPRTELNQIAVDILGLVIQIRRSKSWVQRDELISALGCLCKELAEASGGSPRKSQAGLDTLRLLIREEFLRVGWRATLNPAPQLDPEALKRIVAEEVRAGVASASHERWSDEPLSSAIGRFLEEGSNKAVGKKHRADVERRLAAFLRFVSDKPVRDITRDDIKAYRDVLDSLPDRFSARFGTENMKRAIELNAKRKTPFPTIGPTTVNLKWLGPVDRLFDWLVVEGKIEKNPCDGVRSGQEAAGEAANALRLPFKPHHISGLFAITSKASRASALYWLPLLALCTGARPNEIAQLRTEDLEKDFNGRPHLSVLCLLDEEADPKPRNKKEEEERKQRVKTPAARRMIPLHRILIQAGFVEFVEDRHAGRPKQLFRELRPDANGFWSSAITKRINGIIRKKLKITDRRYSLYSLRHYFNDACKAARIVDTTRLKYMGHQIPGTNGIYGNPLVLEHESQMIDSISFDGIDFANYLKQRV